MGGQEKTFQNETEYLQFLQKDSQSSLLWMDHKDVQAVSNHYKIKIHILTTNIEGVEEPKARWTHLEPDERLKEFSSLPNGLQDLWLMHIDRNHLDLIIEKESILAKEGSIDQRHNSKEELLEIEYIKNGKKLVKFDEDEENFEKEKGP